MNVFIHTHLCCVSRGLREGITQICTSNIHNDASCWIVLLVASLLLTLLWLIMSSLFTHSTLLPCDYGCWHRTWCFTSLPVYVNYRHLLTTTGNLRRSSSRLSITLMYRTIPQLLCSQYWVLMDWGTVSDWLGWNHLLFSILSELFVGLGVGAVYSCNFRRRRANAIASTV
jgi:uncharacterized membrane-anchored protein YitT (DUF2179 family)